MHLLEPLKNVLFRQKNTCNINWNGYNRFCRKLEQAKNLGNLGCLATPDEISVSDTGRVKGYLYQFNSSKTLEELEEKLGISFEDEEFETINGFLISRLEHIPEVGETFDTDYSGYNFKVLAVENFMIQSVLVTKIPEETIVNDELTLDENI